MDKTNEEKTMFDRSPQENRRSWLMILFIAIIISCIIVLIIDCSAPISYGVKYSSRSSNYEGFIFYRNGTYKVKLINNGQRVEYEGKYEIVGSRLKIENTSLNFEIISRTRIQNANEILVSSASVGIIVCSILLSICGIIVAFFVANRFLTSSSKKEERIAELEKQIAELQAKQQDEDK